MRGSFMQRILIIIIASFGAAFAAASWVYRSDLPAMVERTPATVSFDQALPLEARIAALEHAVSDERQARQMLEDEVFYLTGELEMLNEGGMPEVPLPESIDEPVSESRSDRREAYRRRNSAEGRVARLIEAGFMPGQAEQIVRREAELQMDALWERYEAERSGDPVDWWQSRNGSSNALRQELGDETYERYLQANNRSTNVAVSSVIEHSPAAAAGLRAGDEIIRYGGARVFSMTDLTQQTMNGTAGENVAVDIVRDGIQMQVVMPRGPFGISGGRRRR